MTQNVKIDKSFYKNTRYYLQLRKTINSTYDIKISSIVFGTVIYIKRVSKDLWAWIDNSYFVLTTEELNAKLVALKLMNENIESKIGDISKI